MTGEGESGWWRSDGEGERGGVVTGGGVGWWRSDRGGGEWVVAE